MSNQRHRGGSTIQGETEQSLAEAMRAQGLRVSDDRFELAISPTARRQPTDKVAQAITKLSTGEH